MKHFARAFGAALSLALMLAAMSSPALAQKTPMFQSGTVKSGDALKAMTNGLLGSAGGILGDANGRGANPFSVSDVLGLGVCLNSAATGGAFNGFCIGHLASGDAIITLDSYGGLADKTAYFRKNGILYEFPFTVGGVLGPNPTVSGNVTCWNNTSGSLLKDCGYAPRPVIATLAALKATATTSYDTIIRVGNLAIGDMPAAVYKAVNLACVENGGLGDDGGCIKSADGKAWVLAQQTRYDPRWWGACGDFTCDSTAAIFNAAQWVGTNFPGSIIDFGGRGQQYKIGSSPVVGTPLLPLTHAVKFAHGSLYLAGSLTSTTDIIQINPGLADTDGWGYYDMRIFPPTSGIISHAVWRHSVSILDGGDSTKFLRGMEFHDNIFYPSDSRGAGKDLNIAATIIGPAGTGLVVQTTFGPNIYSWAGFAGVQTGDSNNFVGWTISTDGNVSSSSICFDISNGANGAGELVLQDINCTQYGGATIRNTYGTHMRGGVFECQGANIASPSGAMLSIIGAISVQIDATQFQGGGCVTPPKAISVDAGARIIKASPILGSNMAAAAYTIDAAAAPTTDIDKFGNRISYPFFGASLTNPQTGISNNTVTTLHFDTVVSDLTAGYDNSTGLWRPTTDGWYEITANVCTLGTYNGSYQLLLQKNAVTNLAAQSMSAVAAGSATYCLAATGIAFLNGSTDTLSAAVLGVVSAGTLSAQGGATMTIKRMTHG